MEAPLPHPKKNSQTRSLHRRIDIAFSLGTGQNFEGMEMSVKVNGFSLISKVIVSELLE